ncbi:MAG: hypothetical protein ABI645_08625 [Pseudomonadota bacterium]
MTRALALSAAAILQWQLAVADLPVGPERAVVLQHCTVCHTVERVLHSGGSKPGWEDRINRMVRWGARIPAEQIAPVAAYLAGALPIRPAPAPSPAFFANTAVSKVAPQSVHITLRVAAAFDARNRTLQWWLDAGDVRGVNAGQHVRAFSARARTAMITAKVTQIVKQGGRYRVTALVSTAVHEPAACYVAEIGVDLGVLLAVPNEAIIEDGDSQFVYVQDRRGGYERRLISAGVHGEVLTEVVSGLSVGEQVVTVGGFFIDAAWKLAAQS